MIKMARNPKSGDNSDPEPFGRSEIGRIVAGNNRVKNRGQHDEP